MAVTSNTLIGPSRQKVGNTVFSTWKGINVLKQKPISVANPNTDPQIMRRSAMTQMVALFRQIPAAVKLGFKKLAIQKSEWNAFSSYNLKNAFDYSSPPTATLLTDDILISKGTIESINITSVVADRSLNTIVVVFPDTTDGSGQAAGDRTILAVYNAIQFLWISSTGTATRNDGTVTITLPAGWLTGEDIGVYLGFYNSTSGESSDNDRMDGTIVA